MRDDLDIPVPRGGPSYRMARSSSGMDRGTRRLMMLAGGIGGALVLLIGAYSVTAHRKTGIPVIEAASGPVRVKPANPGGLQVFGGDDSMLAGDQDAKATVAPPPESPDPQGLRGKEQTQAAPAVVAQAAPVPQATETPLAVPTKPPAPTPPVAMPPVPMPRQAEAAPAPKPVSPPRAPVASPPVPSPVTSGAMQVQLAALTSEEQAMAEWARLSHRMPDLLGARRPDVTRTEHDGKAWFRLRTGGFADVAQAASFCQRVREKGAACSIASF